ncbi:MAG: hypothetical protein JXA21_16655 [Anaerolineae bacterium]|nr:hypothetical protein [Anaerolineae bacterium]
MTPDPLALPAGEPASLSPDELAGRYNEGIAPPPPPLRVEMLLPRQPVPLARATFSPGQRVLAWVVLLGLLLFCVTLAYWLWGAG